MVGKIEGMPKTQKNRPRRSNQLKKTKEAYRTIAHTREENGTEIKKEKLIQVLGHRTQQDKKHDNQVKNNKKRNKN